MATEPPKRKRRWFRFSLKTFLVLVTLFCVLMAFLSALVYRVNKQREAVQWVQDHGGSVYYDFEWNEKELWLASDRRPPGPDWLRELIGIDYFADVVFVCGLSRQIEDIRPLREFSKLQMLELLGTQVSDLRPLRELTKLKVVRLKGNPISDLEPLSKLPRLHFIDLEGAQVSDLEPLREMTQLRKLDLRYTQVTDLSPLTEMKNVTIYLDEKQQLTIPEELEDRVMRLPSL